MAWMGCQVGEWITQEEEIRNAVQSDRDAVLEFCRRIWKERDYTVASWDGWIGVAGRHALVATASGRPCGVVRAEVLSPGEGWVEGLRVDPLSRSRGVGRRLVQAAVTALAHVGAQFARCLVASDNVSSRRVFERNGFRTLPSGAGELLVQRRRRWAERGEVPAQLVSLGPGDDGTVERLLCEKGRGRKTFLGESGGLYCADGVRWQMWDGQRLAMHLRDGQVRAWVEGDVLALAVVSSSVARPGVVDVGLLDGAGPACRRLLNGLATAACGGEVLDGAEGSVRTFLPLALSNLQRAAGAAGLRSDRVRHKPMHILEWRREPGTDRGRETLGVGGKTAGCTAERAGRAAQLGRSGGQT